MSEGIIERHYDKSSWGPGPWDTEPDRLQWNHAGYACLIVRGTLGALCGYVGVPEEHPYFGKLYQDIENDMWVHEGLSYSDECYGSICHVPEPGFPDKVWWLGFDTAHYNDLVPAVNVPEPWLSLNKDKQYRDIAYVQEETNRLAEQLAAIKVEVAR